MFNSNVKKMKYKKLYKQKILIFDAFKEGSDDGCLWHSSRIIMMLSSLSNSISCCLINSL